MNTQKPSPLISDRDGETLQVHSIFYTIQGEGPFAGERAVFVRLAGCNLRCPGCDTEYTNGQYESTIGKIAHDVTHAQLDKSVVQLGDEPLATNNMGGKRHLVVITGGEPFRQNIGPLVMRLVACGYRVQIETNGSILPSQDFLDVFHSIAGVTVVCAPKGNVCHEIWEVCKDVKYVVSHNRVASDGLPSEVLGLKVKEVSRPPEWWRGTIYVQPADSSDPLENDLNLTAAVASIMTHGYKLCLQLHKIINVE
ncbi:MAG: 7-carboxy-7-deazaguanine synthase QueE [Aeromonas veronii]